MIVIEAARGGSVPPDTLVSIGVPTFNRPHSLSRTLKCLLAQTWPNIEIIISDNASTYPAVADVTREFAARDSRIRYYRQPKNIGAHSNFFFVLNQSSASFFMWAADDDYISPCFVEKCMKVMLSREDIVLCTAETQYKDSEGEIMLLVPQGSGFRKPTDFHRLGRMEHLIRNNFDNLIYGFFRRNALLHDGEIYWNKTTPVSSNEIPALLAAAYHGEIIVLPEARIFKSAARSVYAQATWEELGGFLPPSSRLSGWRSMLSTWYYHEAVIRAIALGLEQLDLLPSERRHLVALSRTQIRRHFLYMLARYKPRSARTSEGKR